MMKIRMLTTEYDNETNEKLWNKGDTFDVDITMGKVNGYYVTKTVNEQTYGVGIDCEGSRFEVVE